ncbi:MAG: hypothetical protein ILP17_09275 [Lachnospiraceae bacterium]|nr:hypothetical protein [Lachnospiraceae bacterium]
MNLETTTAIYAGNVRLSYGMIIAVFAFLSSWMLTVSLAGPGGEGDSQTIKGLVACRLKQLVALLMYGVFAAALASFFGRLIYWYSHYESYDGITGAFSSFEGCFHEAGVVLGFFAAAGISSFFMGKEFMQKMIGASATGMMLFMTLMSLVSMFNDSDRGKAVITDLYHQRLPYSYITGMSGGGTEYRTAVFFWKFILMGIITVISFVLYIRKKSALMTYVCYFSAMALLDSARYDASFLRSNGFVSLMQIVAAVFLLSAMITCLVLSLKKRRLHRFHMIFTLLFFIGIGLVGYMEYYVQRHGDLYIFCYTVMGMACVSMVVSIWIMHDSISKGRGRKQSVRRSEKDESEEEYGDN